MSDDRSNPERPVAQPVELVREQFRSTRIEVHHVPNDSALRSVEEFEKLPVLLHGTAFYYQVDGETFLVTARHLVTGRNQRNGERLHRYAVDPNYLKITFRQTPPERGWRTDESTEAAHWLLPLTDSEGNPTWRESPTYGAKMDAVVIPLSFLADHDYAIDTYELAGGEEFFGSRLWAAQDVFIVGYPYALESGFLMPLWIRGTIATEPTLLFSYRGEQLPILLVDARTREGQSGSPVILFAHPRTPFVRENGQLAYNTQSASRILGVYSGRTSEESDLGFVWRIEEVDRMCRDEIQGRGTQAAADPAGSD